jgi:hypothetical protein
MPFKIGMVIRGYLSGSTGTSAWKAYEKGERMYCGHRLPEGTEQWVSAFPNLKWRQITESPLLGPAGNKEFFVLLEKTA